MEEDTVYSGTIKYRIDQGGVEVMCDIMKAQRVRHA